MNDKTRRDMPKPLLEYIGSGKFRILEDFRMDDSTIMHWIFQDNGETYRLTWWNNGWVIFYQESYLLKTLSFAHKNDIPSFEHSHFGEADGWLHVFEDRNDAVEAFKAHYCKLRGIEPCSDLRLYDEKLPDYGDLISVEDWNRAVDDGSFVNEDGCGYWVKDNLMCHKDEVFSSPQLDATHVMWFNK